MAIQFCGCYSHKDEWPEGYNPNQSGCKFPIIKYEGAVLGEWENNGYNDSDFKAAVWNEEDQKVEVIEWGTTRFPTYHNGCKVDATDEVRAKAAVVKAEATYNFSIKLAEEEQKNPTVGKTVRSLTTRGKNKNLVGTIVFRETNPYAGPFYKNGYKDPNSIYYQRVMVQIWGQWVADGHPDGGFIDEFPTGDERMRMGWMDADKVEVVDPEPIDYDKLRAAADNIKNHPELVRWNGGW